MKVVTTSFPAALVIAVMLTGVAKPDVGPVKVWEDKITLPTYSEEPADPNPDFGAFSSIDTASYPYPLRKKFAERRKEQVWRTLNLENEYLSCRILPDLGGHVYNCRDKIAGREVFYANPVVKKGTEGLRGSWVAMGIESDFPVGHSRTSTSPVDFAYRQNADGSASVLVGTVDRISGMQWRSEYVLRPASAVLEQHVTLYNRSDVRHRYSWWSNAAVEYDDKKTRAILPTRLVMVHETTDVVRWPLASDDSDLSVVANHKTTHGFFAFGCREPFMAVYKPSSRTGVAHFAERGVPGKKLWIWGPDGDDHVKTALTDRFNSFIEIQAGVFDNQYLFEFLQPEELRRFTEYWIPFRDMDGLSRVNVQAALYSERTRSKAGKPSLNVEVQATSPSRASKIEVTCGPTRVLEATADLSPASVFAREVEVDAAEPCTVRVLHASGTPMIEHTEGRYDNENPERTTLGRRNQENPAGPETEQSLIARATRYELDGHLRFAWQDYNLALTAAPNSAALHKAAGRLAVLLGRPEDAEVHESAALSSNATDEEASYYLGIAFAMLGRDAEARSALARVRPGSPFFYAAQLQLAFAAARKGDLRSAVAYSSRAAGDQTSATRAGAVHVAVLRRAGEKDAALAALDRWRAADPADSMLRFERVLLGGKDEGLWAHLAGDAERILNLVDDYISLGFYDSALELLNHSYPQIPANQVEAGSSITDNALLTYYRAYCRTKTGGDATAEWKAASAQSTRYVFPSRFSSYAVLRAALQRNKQDAAAHYLLGSLYMNSLYVDEAIGEWEQARALSPNIESLHRNLGRALLEIRNDPAAAQEVLKEGARVDKQNAEIHPLLDRASSAIHAKTTAKAVVTRGDANASAAAVAIAAMLQAASGSVTAALAEFNSDRFATPDQPIEVRQAYIEVHLQRLLSLASSGRCEEALGGIETLGKDVAKVPLGAGGVEKFIKYPHFQYYLGVVEDKCGRDKAARKRWNRINIGHGRLPAAESVFPYVAAARVDPEATKADTMAGLQAVQTELAKPENSEHTWLLFAQGMLLRVTGQQQDGLTALKRAAATSKDPLVRYLSTVELNLASAPGK